MNTFNKVVFTLVCVASNAFCSNWTRLDTSRDNIQVKTAMSLSSSVAQSLNIDLHEISIGIGVSSYERALGISMNLFYRVFISTVISIGVSWGNLDDLRNSVTEAFITCSIGDFE